jgi:hypothetical protein
MTGREPAALLGIGRGLAVFAAKGREPGLLQPLLKWTAGSPCLVDCADQHNYKLYDMAIHPDLRSLIRESLPEYLLVADYCATFRKDSTWPQPQAGGCLGYPAAVMLFSIVDTIGSFYRGRTDLNMLIGGKARHIRGDAFQHFFVLNSEYYAQALDEPTIKRLYDNFRSLLIHNASLAPESFLINAPSVGEVFPGAAGGVMVNIPALLKASRGAVERFLARLDDVVPGSQQAANIGKKR